MYTYISYIHVNQLNHTALFFYAFNMFESPPLIACFGQKKPHPAKCCCAACAMAKS